MTADPIRLCRVAWCLLLLLASAAVTATGRDANLSWLTVTGGSAGDARLVREGAARASDYLRSYGVSREAGLVVRLTDKPLQAGDFHLGGFDSVADLVRLVTLDRAREQCAIRSPFDLPMDVEMYTGFVAHEVAHAIASQKFAPAAANRLAHEYIAYVVQLSTMDPALRKEVLAAYPQAAFDSPAQMSTTYYALDPAAFAVKVYRHWQGLADRRGFLHGLLSGKVMPGTRQRDRW